MLHRLARDLIRLIAPVLCFTAEEVWQELETLSGREAWSESSVHAQLFPERLEVPVDQALLQRWERLTAVREETNKALEEARQAEKRIGTSLQARVVIEASDPDLDGLLRSFGDELHFLLLSSEVEFGPAGNDAYRSTDVPGLAVEIQTAAGQKCGRCWNYTTDVGQNSAWPEVCARCVTAVKEILSEAGHGMSSPGLLRARRSYFMVSLGVLVLDQA